MSDDDLKTKLAVLSIQLAALDARIEKLEKNVQWATLLIVGSVIAAILKQVGLA